jgi:protein-tyrosine phosphatase
MLDEGLVRILATDAHDMSRRPPNLREGYDRAAASVGAREAEHLVTTRPIGVLGDVAPSDLPLPAAVAASAAHGISRRLRRIFR